MGTKNNNFHFIAFLKSFSVYYFQNSVDPAKLASEEAILTFYERWHYI